MISNAAANSAGSQINRYLDALGLPDAFGDKVGALVDLQKGDVAGFLRNMADLKSGLPTNLFDKLSSCRGRRGFRPCHTPRRNCWGPHLAKCSHTHIYRSRVGHRARPGQSYKLGGFLGKLGIRGRISGRQYRGSFCRPVRCGKSGYLYRGRMYKSMGAIRADLRDGRADGVATRRRVHTHYRSCFPRLPHILKHSFNPHCNVGSLFGSAFSKGIADAIKGIIGNRGGNSGAQAPGNSSSTGGAGSSSGILSNPNLSLEEKLMLLMAKLAKDMDKEIKEKMGALEKASSSKTSGKDAKGADGKGGMAKSDKQQMQTELQMLMQRRQQMFQTMQNMLKSLHDTSMSAVRNLKA